MTDERNFKPQADVIPLAHEASAKAPFVFFDGVPTFGLSNGVANMTLEAIANYSINGEIVTQRIVVAHLRMSEKGLESLKNAAEAIELLARPSPEGRAN